MAVTQPSPKDPAAQRRPIQVLPAEHKPLEMGQWMVLTAAFLGWMFDGVELGLFPIAARPALQDLMSSAKTNLLPPCEIL